MIAHLLADFWESISVILRRYITSQVAITTALVLGFLVVMLLGGRLIRYFGMAAEGGLNVGVLFTLIGYNLPYFLELILPLSLFIGLMLVFGRLYSDHEMAVINASGISRGHIARLLIPLIIMMMCFEGWISLVAKPWGVERATNIWQEQSMAQVFDLIRPKEFVSSGDYHLYVGEVGDKREFLKDVIIVQTKSQSPLPTDTKATNEALASVPRELQSQKDSIIFARSATQVENADGQIQLDLHQGRRYEVDPSSRQYSQIGFERYRITLSAKRPADGGMRIEGVPTMQLLAIIRGITVRDNPLEAYAELGYRLSMPWLIVLAVMQAVPLSYVRPRKGRWLKLIPAIFIYLASVLVVISLKDSITKAKLPPIAYLLVMVLLTAFALYLNYHQRLMARMQLTRQHKEVL